MTSPEEPQKDYSEQSNLRRLIAATMGCFAVLLTGDPEGFTRNKKSKDL